MLNIESVCTIMILMHTMLNTRFLSRFISFIFVSFSTINIVVVKNILFFTRHLISYTSHINSFSFDYTEFTKNQPRILIINVRLKLRTNKSEIKYFKELTY